MKNPNPANREIVLTRVIDAPPELIWEAWTNPEHNAHWWGPQGFTNSIEAMDVRPEGAWKHVMHGPDGTHYPNESVFKEVIRPQRIRYLHLGQANDGPEARFESIWTFFEKAPGKTEVTVKLVFETAEICLAVGCDSGTLLGIRQTLVRLEEHLKTMKSTQQ